MSRSRHLAKACVPFHSEDKVMERSRRSSGWKSLVLVFVMTTLTGTEGSSGQDLFVPNGSIHVGVSQPPVTFGHLNIVGDDKGSFDHAVLNLNTPTAHVWAGLEAFQTDSSQIAILQLVTDHDAVQFGLWDDQLRPGAPIWVATFGGPGLRSASDTFSFLVDADNDSSLGFNTHRYVWYLDEEASGSRMMELQRVGFNSAANLLVDGTVTANGFDLAEGFWMSEPIAPGDVVALDPARPGAVVKAAGFGDPLLLGVVSREPALVMGGHAFSADRLRAAWGAEAADLFETERPGLEAEAYAEVQGLVDSRDRVASEPAYSAWREASDLPRPRSLSEPARAGERAGLGRELEEARAAHRVALEDEVLRRFYQRHVAAVALAGRVQVNVDASYGPIVAGDRLTAGPAPGVAVRASQPGPALGIALESLPAGTGSILVLVDREWYPGDEAVFAALSAARSDERLEGLETALRDREMRLAALEHRLAELEARLVPREGRARLTAR